MYSVFIVDDEHIVLEGIRNKIDWENTAFSFAGEATDGELAFSMIQEMKPDILITDIKMPFMDGLELSRLLKKIQPWIKIIILSGHDEFDYAKKAISIGVEDYILKPFTHEELLDSLNKVAQRLDEEKKRKLDITKLKEELESSAILVRNKYLSDLISGSIDTANILQEAKKLNIDIIARYHKVIISELKTKEETEETGVLQKVYSSLLDISKNVSDVISFFISPKRFVSILKNNSVEDIDEYSYNFAEAIEHVVSQNMECNVITAIGKTVEHTSNIASSYSDADHILNQARFWNKSRILSADDIKKSSDGILSLQENDPLMERLKYAQTNEIEEIISQYLDLLKDNSEHFQVIASYLFVDVIMAVSKLVENLGGNIKEVMPEILSHSFVDNAVQNQDIFVKEIRKILKNIFEYRDSKIQGRYGEVILKAKEYINKNYSSQDTSLKLVAEEVHLSPNHFSTIFSQECGITFIEYLTNVRINEAKRLLKTTDMKGADIAYDCGFSDPHYFSFIFKKNTGMTPREYKNS
ncbi:MAG: response regulator [Treponema sp.]|nr:response regulator [Treponema sp.]